MYPPRRAPNRVRAAFAVLAAFTLVASGWWAIRADDVSAAACGVADSDGDGLVDCEEDANLDADADPATNPGPDIDGDGTPNHLDPDDDGDGIPTSLEGADPDGDGDPRDAVDSDHDGQPDWLDRPTTRAFLELDDQSRITSALGGLVGPIDNADQLGEAMAAIGDLDGDGVTDLAISAVQDDDGGSNRGAVYVLFMNPDGSVKTEQKISSTSGGLTGPLDDGDRFGHAITALGDLDGDGVVDLAVGVYEDDDGGSRRGAVYVLFMNRDGTVRAEQKISSIAGGLTGPLDDTDRFGASVTALGDLDGDGIVDLAVGVRDDDDGGDGRGAVYVLFLNADGTVKAEQKISSVSGGLMGPLDDLDRFGTAIGTIGDLDGDGIVDLAVGAQDDDDGGDGHGAVYVLFLNADGTVKAEQKISSTAGDLVGPLDVEDQFGIGVAGLGDIDGDGLPDLVVGANGDDDGGSGRGAVHVLTLNTDGSVNEELKVSSTAGGLTEPIGNGDGFGVGVAGLGDLDGDGSIGLIVGARKNDDGGGNRGALYLLDLVVPPDTDGDGLRDWAEDADTDGDGDPSTNPGPDIDGDGTPNHLDDDDDGDGIPTSLEGADPDGDGDPADAVDSTGDGLADWLDPTVPAPPTTMPPATTVPPTTVPPIAVPEAPSALTEPRSVSTSTIEAGVRLSWSAPAVGGDPTGHLVEYSTDGTTWTAVGAGPDRAVDVTGLAPGVRHLFRVAEVSASGTTPFSAAVEGFPGRAVPAALGTVGLDIARGLGFVPPDDVAIQGVATTGDGRGGWAFDATGGVYAFGDAEHHGSMEDRGLSSPAVGLVTTRSGDGYLLVSDDGGVFAFGAAEFHGSATGLDLASPISSVAFRCSGTDGYWLTAPDGGVFAFGDAEFLGSMGGTTLNAPVVGLAPTCDGAGYWLVAADGGVFAFGSATFQGSLGDTVVDSPITRIVPTATDDGYWLVAANGTVHPFGDAAG
ncbi:MAG: FG-GAP-like repeat-containing protein [Actinomycetota bacterium]